MTTPVTERAALTTPAIRAALKQSAEAADAVGEWFFSCDLDTFRALLDALDAAERDAAGLRALEQQAYDALCAVLEARLGPSYKQATPKMKAALDQSLAYFDTRRALAATPDTAPPAHAGQGET